MLKKLAIPVKLQQPFGIVGGINFGIALILLLNGLTQNLPTFYKYVSHIL